MGLSTKLVSIDDDHGLDTWGTCSSQSSLPEPLSIRRQPPPKPVALKCPRCDSTNTKFCYYNNYNKSQPRHYCKGCKRHWTEGGTLRNVPVGGGRKNKRLRPTESVDHITTERKKIVTLEVNNQRCPLISTTTTSTPGVTIRGNSTIVSTIDEDIKKENDIFYETLNLPSSSLPYDIFSGLKLSIPQDGNTHFSFTYDNVPCSIIPNSSTTQSSNNYNEYIGKFDSTMEESTITTVMPNTSSSDQQWQVPETSNDLINENLSSNYWNWNEFDTLSAADLNLPWDDLEIKP